MNISYKWLKEYVDFDLSAEEGRKAALEILDAEVGKFKKGGEFEGMFPERWLPSCFAVLAEPFPKILRPQFCEVSRLPSASKS